jgi:uncharacterized protein YkwD
MDRVPAQARLKIPGGSVYESTTRNQVSDPAGITRKKTYIMRRTRIALTRIALVATLLTAFTALAPSPAHAATARARMYQATNNSRLTHGVRKVNIHYTMSKLARRHSIAMANRGTIFHTSNPSSFYLRGVRWSTWGENVGVTGGTIGGMQAAFMNSPGHRSNILNRGFHRVAVGTYRANGFLWVTVFFYG